VQALKAAAKSLYSQMGENVADLSAASSNIKKQKKKNCTTFLGNCGEWASKTSLKCFSRVIDVTTLKLFLLAFLECST
jgi:hypothetical protein